MSTSFKIHSGRRQNLPITTEGPIPRFVFQVQQSKFPEIPAIEDILCGSYAAREAALGICADLAKDIVNRLTDDSEWRLDVLDESGEPVFRLRLLAESLDKAPA
jgi:hypothetical protein